MLDEFLRDAFAVALLISLSLGGRAALVASGQTWVTTFAHTATLTTLPIITFIITKVISGNIALSLGMIGALSIVRFRNPVKSPFELSVYFAAITMGISASVSLKWLVFFCCSMALALIALAMASYIANRFFGKSYFVTSFSEGNRLSTLEVEASAALPAVRDNSNLISEARRDDVYTYILASEQFTTLQNAMRSLESEGTIIEARLNK